MATLHVQYSWQQSNTRTGGFREGFWNNAATPETVKPRADSLLTAWNQFKGNPVYCPSYRISFYPGTRLALPVLTGFLPGTPSDADESDYPTVKVQLEITGTTGQKTTQWIGGIRDRDTKRGGFWQPTGNTTRNFNAVKTQLESVANGWSINVLNVTFPKLVVTAFNDTTGQVTTGTNHGYANLDVVRIQRLNGIDGINGLWQIANVDATHFTLIGWVATGGTMTRSNARVQKQDHVLVPIRSVRIVQVTSHKVGRPTALLGGRKKRPGRTLVGPLVAK